jgi:SpoVK/Ycf46/Vps4 family AAA+-type ATPase
MAEAKDFVDTLRRKALYVEAGGNPRILQMACSLVITGNPGTGKTTFARLLARFMHAYGLLPRDAFVEKNALELKGAYLGQTAPKVKDAFESAMGGVLFLDEAYALGGGAEGGSGMGGTDKFGAEAIRTLLTEVENNRTDVMVILAGYVCAVCTARVPCVRRLYCSCAMWLLCCWILCCSA